MMVVLAVAFVASGWAQKYKLEKDVSYTAKTDAYAQERLKLDIYYPTEAKDVPVVVWFHGGGLEQGNKEIPSKLKEKGCSFRWYILGPNNDVDELELI